MNKIMLLMISLIGVSWSCSPAPEKDLSEKWKQEITKTEEDFAAMAANEGISAAFIAYAADDAVLMRNDRLIIGKPALTEHFQASEKANRDVQLKWAPDFVGVSASGDLGYTYGKYTVSYPDSTGQRLENTGVFHTVWRRQDDGSWKFVWD